MKGKRRKDGERRMEKGTEGRWKWGRRRRVSEWQGEMGESKQRKGKTRIK